MKTVKGFYKQPDKSIIDRDLSGDVHYIDSFGVEFNDSKEYSIDFLTAHLFSSMPEWAENLLRLRDALVRPFGLATGGIPSKKAIDPSLRYSVGERAVFFTVIDRSTSEIVMAEDDKHLYFRISAYFERIPGEEIGTVYLTTLVTFHGFWGRLYFLPVKPFHKFIVKALLGRFSSAFE